MTNPVREKIYCVPVRDDRNRIVGWELYLNGHRVDSGPLLEPLREKFAAATTAEFIQLEEKYVLEEILKHDKIH